MSSLPSLNIARCPDVRAHVQASDMVFVPSFPGAIYVAPEDLEAASLEALLPPVDAAKLQIGTRFRCVCKSSRVPVVQMNMLFSTTFASACRSYVLFGWTAIHDAGRARIHVVVGSTGQRIRESAAGIANISTFSGELAE